MEHNHHASEPSDLRLAFSATLHCLLGCGLGEVAGMIISRALGLGTVISIILAVTLGFVFGFILGMMPLRRAGMAFGQAVRIVMIAEGLSIAVMETAEVLVQVYTPGVMQAGLTEGIFWLGMGLSLVAGFIAAFPVNVILIGRGVRHHH